MASTPAIPFSWAKILIIIIQIPQITPHQQRHLQSNRIIKPPKIQPRLLLNLIQPVNQCIPVDIQLPRCLRCIQVILKKLFHQIQRLLIKHRRQRLPENLPQIHLT